MPSHKTLGSISHNFSHSFISLNNYLDDDYILGHILTQAHKTGKSRLTIDFLQVTAKPDQLLTTPIKSSIVYWARWFPTLVENQGSSMAFVSAAIMVIEFDLSRAKPHSWLQRSLEAPFRCEMIVTDDSGKQYIHIHEGWWYPEKT